MSSLVGTALEAELRRHPELSPYPAQIAATDQRAGDGPTTIRLHSLRHARHAASLSQDELAKQADVSLETLRRAERGLKVGANAAQAIAVALGVDVDAFAMEYKEFSDLVSRSSVYTDGTLSSEAAVLWRLRMNEAFAKIDDLAALVPDERREAYRAKARADFAAAAGLALPVADTRREPTNLVREEPRRRSIADAKAEALAIGDTTLLGQLNRLEERLASTELPTTGLTSLEQAQAASRLHKTYRDAQARLLGRNLEPLPEDSRVADAARLYMDFKRKNPELKKRTTRASPLRQHSAKAPSAT